MDRAAKEDKSHTYWQDKLNGTRHYVQGTNWLTERAIRVRELQVFPLNVERALGQTKLIAYLEDGIIYSTRFANYNDAQEFVTRIEFNTANKDIYSK